MTSAAHIAFEVERAWADDVIATLAIAGAGGEAPLGAVLERWWARREARLAVAVVALADDERARLALDDAPAMVRWVALEHLRRLAPRLPAMERLGAPAMILDDLRRQLAHHRALLDPATPWVGDPPPELPLVPPEEEGDVARPDLHAWLDLMLHAGHADAPELGLGEAFGATPEAAQFQTRGEMPPSPPMSDGWQQTTFGMWPDLDFWASPRIALPRRLDVPGTPPQMIATEAGGPVFVAFAGDPLDPALDPSLAAQVAGLASTRALVSFVWLETDPAGPWQPS